jgi:hypothetical protein
MILALESSNFCVENSTFDIFQLIFYIFGVRILCALLVYRIGLAQAVCTHRVNTHDITNAGFAILKYKLLADGVGKSRQV